MVRLLAVHGLAWVKREREAHKTQTRNLALAKPRKQNE